MEDSHKNIHVQHENEAKQNEERIFQSTARKKIIIAGPGTGKSTLFEKICKKTIENGGSNILALSFINELVDDLIIKLHKLSEVKTLHSFALGFMPKDNRNIFLNLENIIEEDYRVINNIKIDYKKIFSNLTNDKDGLDFYSKRRKYYNYFSPNSSIYTLIKMFEKDESKIPQYSQILIDEFQDFNKLEIELINLLSKKSLILIVGDDDQSLYDFKFANPDEIRKKYSLKEFEPFELPFCFRCTKVTVNAFNDIIKNAKENGFLKERISKSFKYFSSQKKDDESNQNPKILIKNEVYQGNAAFYIDSEIKKIVHPEDKLKSILIICPLKKQAKDLYKKLNEKGYLNINIKKEKKENKILEGFNILLTDSRSNLGWRIIAKNVDNKLINNDINKLLVESYKKDHKKPFMDFLDVKGRAYIRHVLSIFNKLKNNKKISDNERKTVFECLNYQTDEIALSELKKELNNNKIQKNTHKNISIQITNILGSKGLTKDYVFLVNYDDKYLLSSKNGKPMITDNNICNFLVSLTRAKIRTYLFTSQKKLPTFMDWVNKDCFEII